MEIYMCVYMYMRESTCARVVTKWCCGAHVDVSVEARPLQRGVVERGVVGAVGGEGPTAGLDLTVPLRTPHTKQRKHHFLHHIDTMRQEHREEMRIRQPEGQPGEVSAMEIRSKMGFIQ